MTHEPLSAAPSAERFSSLFDFDHRQSRSLPGNSWSGRPGAEDMWARSTDWTSNLVPSPLRPRRPLRPLPQKASGNSVGLSKPQTELGGLCHRRILYTPPISANRMIALPGATPSKPVSRTPADQEVQRTSWRMSKVLDVGEGHVNQRQLSCYLADVLDPAFQIPRLPAHAVDVDLEIHCKADQPAAIESHVLLRPREHCERSREDRPISFEAWDRPNAPDSRRYLVPRCQCPYGAIICHCQSSEEFENFRRWHSHHKANPSVSSTVCLLSIPRARFVVDNDAEKVNGVSDAAASRRFTPTASPIDNHGQSQTSWPLSAGPDNLVFEETTQEVDHQRAYTPDRQVSVTEPEELRRSSLSSQNVGGLRNSLALPSPPVKPRITSFSRPFRPESGGNPRGYFSTTPRSSCSTQNPQSPRTPPHSPLALPSPPQLSSEPYLKRISTLSSFHVRTPARQRRLDVELEEEPVPTIPLEIVLSDLCEIYEPEDDDFVADSYGYRDSGLFGSILSSASASPYSVQVATATAVKPVVVMSRAKQLSLDGHKHVKCIDIDRKRSLKPRDSMD